MGAEVWLSLMVNGIMMVISVITLSKTNKREIGESAEARAKLAADVSYIRGGMDDLKVEIRVMRTYIRDLETRVALCEGSLKSEHKRIDAMERRLKWTAEKGALDE